MTANHENTWHDRQTYMRTKAYYIVVNQCNASDSTITDNILDHFKFVNSPIFLMLRKQLKMTPPAWIYSGPSSSFFSEDWDWLTSCYESQTMSSARRLVCIFLRSLSRWRLPCALLRDADGLTDDGPTLDEKKTLLWPSAADTADFRQWPFSDFFTTPFFNSCKHNISVYNHSTIVAWQHSRQE